MKALIIAIWLAGGGPQAPVADVQTVWTGPDGGALPFRTDEDVLDFLRAATVVAEEPIYTGINRSLKLLLERDGVRAHAIFRSVNVRLPRDRPDRRGAAAPRDSFAFECAAYELSRLLGLDRVPPVVARRHGDRPGSVQIWVENAMDEATRRRRGLEPTDQDSWARQVAERTIFDALIGNSDRNLQNSLVDSRGKVWLVDHTRTFPPDKTLPDRQRIVRDERLLARLQSVDRDLVRRKVGPHLEPAELRALWARWDKLVRRLRPGE